MLQTQPWIHQFFKVPRYASERIQMYMQLFVTGDITSLTSFYLRKCLFSRENEVRLKPKKDTLVHFQFKIHFIFRIEEFNFKIQASFWKNPKSLFFKQKTNSTKTTQSPFTNQIKNKNQKRDNKKSRWTKNGKNDYTHSNDFENSPKITREVSNSFISFTQRKLSLFFCYILFTNNFFSSSPSLASSWPSWRRHWWCRLISLSSSSFSTAWFQTQLGNQSISKFSNKST